MGFSGFSSGLPQEFVQEFLGNSFRGVLEFLRNFSKRSSEICPAVPGSACSSSTEIPALVTKKFLQEFIENSTRSSSEQLLGDSVKSTWDFLQKFFGDPSRITGDFSKKFMKKLLQEFPKNSFRSYSEIFPRVPLNSSESCSNISPKIHRKFFQEFPAGGFREFAQEFLHEILGNFSRSSLGMSPRVHQRFPGNSCSCSTGNACINFSGNSPGFPGDHFQIEVPRQFLWECISNSS